MASILNHPHRPIQWRFWPLQIFGWLGVALFSTPLKVVFLGSWKAALMATLLREGIGFLLSSGMRYLYRAISSRQPMRQHLGYYSAIILLTSIAAAVVDSGFVYLVGNPLISPKIEGDIFLLGTFCYRIGLFCFWSLLFFGIRLMQEGHAAERAWYEAEFRMLRAQINPHFLFNALNTLGVEQDRATLSQRVDQLAAYLRYSLRFRSRVMVPLGDEFDAALNYLAIEKSRFGEELELEAEISPEARAVLVPGVVVQPLLENAVKHGRRTSPSPLRIWLAVHLTPGRGVEIRVGNSGRWTPSERRPGKEEESGVGLENLRQRLHLLYRDNATLETREGQGCVIVTVRLPSTPTPSAP